MVHADLEHDARPGDRAGFVGTWMPKGTSAAGAVYAANVAALAASIASVGLLISDT